MALPEADTRVRTGGSSASGIVTPEAVVLDLATAGFASRLSAALIDLSLMVLIGLGAMIAVGLVSAAGGSFDESTVVTIGAFVVFGLLFGYPILFETKMRGRTPGKAAVGLRAVTVDGAPITLRDATLRAMGGVVDRLLPPGGITGVLFVLATPRHQRVGDLIAGTIVIRDPRRSAPPPALWFSPPPGWEQYASGIDPSAITVDQYTVIRSFLTRLGSLSPPVRGVLAADFAERLAGVTGFARHPDVHAEAYLICVIARYQRMMGAAAPRADR